MNQQAAHRMTGIRRAAIMCGMNTEEKKLSVVFLDSGTVDCGDVSLARFTDTWSCTFYESTPPEQTAARLAGRQAAVSNKVLIDAAVMDAREAADLKLIAVAATGTNNVDLEAARERGIAVCNVAGYSTRAVVQHTFAFILEFAANAGRYARDVAVGAWSESPFFCMLTRTCTELDGKTLGIIGLGQIGRAVADAAPVFGLDVLVSQRPGDTAPLPPGRVALDDLLARADFVTLHCPLTPQTQNLIGARELDLMKPGAFLINMARGGIVEEEALIAALDAGRIAGAAADVLTQEKPAPGHPMMRAAARLDNLLITPHTAWSAREARQRLLNEIAENITAFEQGRDRNRVV